VGGTCYRHTNRWNQGRWHWRGGYVVELGRARCLFFSADPRSNNVTTLLWGIAWTSDTLLARTIRHLQRIQAQDGRRCDFKYDAVRVGAEVPACAAYVAGEAQASISCWGQNGLIAATRSVETPRWYPKPVANRLS